MTDTLTITEPGVYPDIPDDVYHADCVEGGSLSSSGARKLLPPSCPAKFAYERDHGREPKKEFDHGHAAHRTVLGVGPEIAALDFDSWRTNAVKEKAAAARAEGKIPLLFKDAEMVLGMAKALKSHKLAMKLLRSGRAEQTLVWRDVRTGVNLRARLDVLPESVSGKRLIVPDYKTADKADDVSVQKAISEHGYHIQGWWYTSAVQELGLAPDGAWFVLIVQEKKPPYLVNVVSPTPSSLFIGGEWAAHAIDIYKRCTETGEWPGYPSEITPLELPAWTEKQYENARMQGLFDGGTR